MSNAPSQSDRILAPSRNLERAELPELRFAGIYEYQVLTATPLGVSAKPTASWMPPIQLVPAGPIGITTLLALIGKNVLVAFVNEDPGRPFVMSVAIPQTALTDAQATVLVAGTPTPVLLSPPTGAIVAPLVAP